MILDTMAGSSCLASLYLNSRLLEEDSNGWRLHVIVISGCCVCEVLETARNEISDGLDPINTPYGMSHGKLA